MVELANRTDELAPDLAEYRGQWVALKNDHVVASGDTPAEVLDRVRVLDIDSVALHRVPEDGDSAYIL